MTSHLRSDPPTLITRVTRFDSNTVDSIDNRLAAWLNASRDVFEMQQELSAVSSNFILPRWSTAAINLYIRVFISFVMRNVDKDSSSLVNSEAYWRPDPSEKSFNNFVWSGKYFSRETKAIISVVHVWSNLGTLRKKTFTYRIFFINIKPHFFPQRWTPTK